MGELGAGGNGRDTQRKCLISRRQFLGAAAAAGGLTVTGGCMTTGTTKCAAGRKAPFRLLFNNDCTNITSCVSPYHKKGEPFRPEMLEATVDEAVGVDAHLLMPGAGWVPWWPSKVLPIEKQHQWFRDTYGIEPANSVHDYLLEGGDLVKVFVERCRLRGQAPFISYRLNDSHHFEKDEKPEPWVVACLNAFYKDHPEYRIAPSIHDWDLRVHNWAIPEVREYKYAFIEELCENYDLDGFELDFMRHCSFFDVEKTASEERAEIMTAFVAQVRALLDRTAKPGQHRWLSVRVPCWLSTCDRIGVDPKAMAAAGVDMLNLSPYYFTHQDHDLEKVRAMVPGPSIYLELTHGATPGPALGPGYDDFSFVRTTEQQLYTTAHMAYEQGADGISLFNFVYYREHGTPKRGPFNEPPFHVFPHLKDPAWLATQPQWYFLGGTRGPKRDVIQSERDIEPGQSLTYAMKCAPEDGLGDGIVRLMTTGASGGCEWKAKLNGAELTQTESVLKPLDHPYDGGLGHPDQYACFKCPRSLVKKGDNQIEITLVRGEEATICYVDLALPRKS